MYAQAFVEPIVFFYAMQASTPVLLVFFILCILLQTGTTSLLRKHFLSADAFTYNKPLVCFYIVSVWFPPRNLIKRIEKNYKSCKRIFFSQLGDKNKICD